MVHLLLVLAQHQSVQARLVAEPDDEAYLDRVIAETLRSYPLFGIAHRITSAAIPVDERTTLPAGAVLCFNYPDYHRAGFADAERFDPDRWEHLVARDAAFVPFGVAPNRPCPAQGLASITVRVATREVLRHFALYSTAGHTRSIPNRGPCLVVSRSAPIDPQRRAAWLAFLEVRDRWEDVSRSLVQLALGTYMVWDARRLRLCQRYFAAHPPAADAPPQPSPEPAVCPVAGPARR